MTPFVLLTVAVALVAAVEESVPEVQIQDGSLRPAMETSRGGKPFMAFLGVPYAEPPVGPLRFQAPKPAKPLTGTLNATEPKPVCLHYDFFGVRNISGAEDCLYMNVFVPGAKPNASANLPVMVWFHNGAYMWGTGSHYGAQYFMDEDVILVMPNWRISILGFMNGGVEEAQGNMGLKDQVLVLKWVKDNIAKFGGDPALVTIFGDLAGGASVQYHMHSRMSEGLFSRAISQGGSALCPWAFNVEPVRTVKRLANFLELPTDNMTTVVQMLRDMDGNSLVKMIPKLFEWDTSPINLFGPTAEIVGEESSKFIDSTPFKFLQKPPLTNVPWIQGMNEDLGFLAAEGLVMEEKTLKDLNEDWLTVAPSLLFYQDTALDKKAVSEAIREEFFQNQSISKGMTLRPFADLEAQRTFGYGNRKSVLSHLKQTEEDPKPVYLYHFTKHCNHSISGTDLMEHGPTEGDELQFLFNFNQDIFKDFYPTITKEDEVDLKFSQNFISLWVNFARHGNTEQSTWNGKPLTWMPVNRTEVLQDPLRPIDQYLALNDDETLLTVKEPYSDRIKFWDNLPLNEYEKELVSRY